MDMNLCWCISLWEEIKEVITSINASMCKISKEKTKLGKVLYSKVALNKIFKERLSSLYWQESRINYYVR